MNGFERLRHPAPSGWMSPKQGNIQSNLPRKKYIKHTNPNTRADKISKKKKRVQKVEQRPLALDLAGWHMSGHHTWLHSDTEFPSGSRALAFSKIFQFCPDWFLAFFKISSKSVQIVAKPPLPFPGVLQPGASNSRISRTHFEYSWQLELDFLNRFPALVPCTF